MFTKTLLLTFAASASVLAGAGPTRTEIVMNYLSGLRYRPLERK